MTPAVSTASAADTLQDHAVLWSIGELRSGDLVDAACDALVAGLDSPALRCLAACTRGEADYDVPDLLPPALEELGLTFRPRGSLSGREAAVRVLATRMLAGEFSPDELVFRVHRLCGHGLPLARRLAELNDRYGRIEYGETAPAELDAAAVVEARRLVHRPPVPTGEASTDPAPTAPAPA
ncbi:hypothetical protein ACGFRB_22215 [Streptomyces sp. NPDC048718]|uniref:hypothetical protein n=1 Tax=Streptomyces sp. NPDC048718 TaxID=3365587 RepID=UPI0037186271